MNTESKDGLELDLLLEAVSKCYDYDFRNYARASMLRRVRKFVDETGSKHISDLIPLLIHDQGAFLRFVKQMSVPVTELFRDPGFFRALRDSVIPLLQTYPFVKIWHAGCATGQEVYSLAILLEEEGLLERCQIYATDFNDDALDIARKGIYSSKSLKLYQQNYEQAKGKKQLMDYFHQKYNSIKINDYYSENITFANHNLVSDGVFGEMHLVLCRNVLIYFNQELQNRVLGILVDSLCPFGTLCIGKRENLRFSPVADRLDAVNIRERIYRKKK